MTPMLRTELAGMTLRSPVLLAAGTGGTLDEMGEVLDLSLVGGIVTKSITPEPREGNPAWRVAPVKAGMLNAIGLANVGVAYFVEHLAPRIGGVPAPVIASIAGFSIDDYIRVAAEMDEIEALPAVELNVSCPNVAHGTEFGSDPRLLGELIRAVRPVLSRTRMIVKLPPMAVAGSCSIVELARAAIDPGSGAPVSGPGMRPGADALSLCNTTPGMGIDIRTRRPLLGNITGGLSGPAVHQVVVRLVHLVYRGVAKETGTAIVGVGGVMRWDDAAELILAGASAVQVGTALFVDPGAPEKIARGLAKWGKRQGVSNLGELVGGVMV
jgi:dihydroorotate dehydrogenase (NAD+) catalytic subunit